MGVRQIWRFIRVTETPPMDFVDAITPILGVASPKLPRSRRNATGVLFATCFLLCTDAAAQPTTGAVRGIVRDQSGGVLPAVQLFLTDPLTHLTQQRSTDERGEFSFQFVEPREYSLIATLPGFKTVRVNELRVHVAATSTVSLVMEVGGATGSGFASDGAGGVTACLATRLSPLDVACVDRSPPHAAGTAIRANKMQRNCDFMVVLMGILGVTNFIARASDRALARSTLVGVCGCENTTPVDDSPQIAIGRG